MSRANPWPVQLFTVTQLTSRIRECLHKQFRDVLVEGEVSNCKLYPSGHLYFTLKDHASALKAVMFNFADRYPQNLLKDGSAVICRGRIDVYEKRGEYRILVEEIEPKGVGLLQLQFEMLKERLYNEGLFDTAHKRPLPLLPRKIGLVTSPSGAAIRDMLKIILGKFENMHVLIYPVRVQGERACDEVVEGIDFFNREDEVDVIIVGRGGGSLEDLACFNEERLARAIYGSHIPIVSAVGHEVDFTIADFVADMRAPTPTAAADLVVRDKRELQAMLRSFDERLLGSLRGSIERSRLVLYRHIVDLKERRDFIVRYRMYLDELLGTLTHGLSSILHKKRGIFQGLTQRLEDLNPESIMKRGYSITMRTGDDKVITSADQADRGDAVRIRLYQGQLDCTVDETHTGSSA
jgi:exodeoxyribonuclease VII large subunit